jgi:hypothetical protein
MIDFLWSLMLQVRVLVTYNASVNGGPGTLAVSRSGVACIALVTKPTSGSVHASVRSTSGSLVVLVFLLASSQAECVFGRSDERRSHGFLFPANRPARLFTRVLDSTSVVLEATSLRCLVFRTGILQGICLGFRVSGLSSLVLGSGVEWLAVGLAVLGLVHSRLDSGGLVVEATFHILGGLVNCMTFRIGPVGVLDRDVRGRAKRSEGHDGSTRDDRAERLSEHDDGIV